MTEQVEYECPKCGFSKLVIIHPDFHVDPRCRQRNCEGSWMMRRKREASIEQLELFGEKNGQIDRTRETASS